MKRKLRLLSTLQKIDLDLDELYELRGDLPIRVEKLREKVETVRNSINEHEDFLKKGTADRARREKESLALLEKIEKLKDQQLQVRNNREYDALTSEIELAEKTIDEYEEEMEAFARQAEELRSELEGLDKELKVLEADLEEQEQQYKEILESTADEEAELKHEREKIIRRLESSDIEAYERIRDAKGGKAVVEVRRESCSGCYNVVPPQRILEIKRDDRLFFCEHCGRILVSEDIAEDDSPVE